MTPPEFVDLAWRSALTIVALWIAGFLLGALLAWLRPRG